MPFKKGESGNPAGKARGTRDAITQAFLKDLDKAWRKIGPQAIEAAAEQQPALFLKVVASLLPRDVQISAADSFLEALKEINAQRQTLLEQRSEAPLLEAPGRDHEVTDQHGTTKH